MGPHRYRCGLRTNNDIDFRTENRQLNAAIHRVALPQVRFYPQARAMLERRGKDGDGGMEALRILKRRLSDVLFRAMLEDSSTNKMPNAA